MRTPQKLLTSLEIRQACEAWERTLELFVDDYALGRHWNPKDDVDFARSLSKDTLTRYLCDGEDPECRQYYSIYVLMQRGIKLGLAPGVAIVLDSVRQLLGGDEYIVVAKWHFARAIYFLTNERGATGLGKAHTEGHIGLAFLDAFAQRRDRWTNQPL